MEWLSGLVSGENGSGFQLVAITVALAIVLVLIVWIVRMIAGGGKPRGVKGRVRRLYVSESTRVDDKRFLVLVRRDNVEHLVLIGGPSDIVVENNILRMEQVVPREDGKDPASTTVAASSDLSKPGQLAREPENPDMELSAMDLPASTAPVQAKPSRPQPDKGPENHASPRKEVAPQSTRTAGNGSLAARGAAGAAALGAVAGTVGSSVAAGANTVSGAAANTAHAVGDAMEDTTLLVEEITASVGTGSTPKAPVVAQSQTTVPPAAPVQPKPETRTEQQSEMSSPGSSDKSATEVRFEDAIMSELDDALAAENLPSSLETPPPASNTKPVATNEPEIDDEMQRLLRELSGETTSKG